MEAQSTTDVQDSRMTALTAGIAPLRSSKNYTMNWVEELIAAYCEVAANNSLTDEDLFFIERNRLYEQFFGEVEWGRSENIYSKISLQGAGQEKLDTYDKLLQSNCLGVQLSDAIYHVTTWSRFCDSIRYGGFVLAHPKDWSVQWEDSAFKNLLKKRFAKDGGVEAKIKDFVDCYQRYTYAMCWSLSPWNKSVHDKKKRDMAKSIQEPLVLLKSSVKKLLSAYYQDRSSFARCFICRVNYEGKTQLKSTVPCVSDLYNGDIGTYNHWDSVSTTSDEFEAQNEVRLLFEDVDDDREKTVLTQNDLAKRKEKVMIAKAIDLHDVIEEVWTDTYAVRSMIQGHGFHLRYWWKDFIDDWRRRFSARVNSRGYD